MSVEKSDENTEGVDTGEEGWDEIDVVGGAAPVTKPVENGAVDRVYSRKPTAPPWMMGMYTASAGLVMALLLLVLPEFRQFNLTSTTSLDTGYLLMIIPAIAILWSLGGLIHKEYTADRGKAVSAMVVALVAGIVLGYAIVTDPAKQAVMDGQTEEQQRLDMTEEEMEQWRREKLNR